MTNQMIHDEFPLLLSTGEELKISVIQFMDLDLPGSVIEECLPVLDLCTKVTNEELEEAKAGYDTNFKKRLKSPPNGCLLRMDFPVCGEIKYCSIASINTCTTRNLDKKRIPQFPICWTYDSDNLDAKALVDSIIHAWREMRHVILVVA